MAEAVKFRRRRGSAPEEEERQQLREEMEKYESQALRVVDEETSLPPEGAAPRELTEGKEFRLNLLEAAAGWARFLM